jgi:hypothetical protein
LLFHWPDIREYKNGSSTDFYRLPKFTAANW